MPAHFRCARIVSVKTVLKSLLVWVLLLAVPFQGFASATMLMCAPMQPATAAAPHDHGAMLAAQAAGHDHSTGQSAAGHHAKGKCNACAACCFGAAMPPSHFSRVPVEAQSFAVDPVDAGFVPAVDLAFPERPPISSLA
jgi:hypothetical protein